MHVLKNPHHILVMDMSFVHKNTATTYAVISYLYPCNNLLATNNHFHTAGKHQSFRVMFHLVWAGRGVNDICFSTSARGVYSMAMVNQCLVPVQTASRVLKVICLSHQTTAKYSRYRSHILIPIYAIWNLNTIILTLSKRDWCHLW